MRTPRDTGLPADHFADLSSQVPTDVPGLALVRLAARLVPGSRRDEWIAEWAGELACTWADGQRDADRDGRSSLPLRLHLLARALGAVPDALCLRRLHGASTVHSLDMDLRVAVRTLRRRPGFVAVVVLTLALGIGATTALFSVVNGVLLRPLPLPDAERVVLVQGAGRLGNTEKAGPSISYPDFTDIRAAARSFDALGAVRGQQMALVDGRGEPATVAAQ